MCTARWINAMLFASFSAASLGQAPTSQPAPPATGFLFKTLTVDKTTYAYSVYVPPEYTAERAWPVILFLHGAGERGEDGLVQTEVGIGTAIRRHRDLIPAIVVMPQCRPGQAWVGDMANMALACLDATTREYRVDPQRVYLTGLSLGGHGSWMIAAEQPTRFAAVVPVCGFVDRGDGASQAAKIAQRLAKVPIWCFHGEADRVVPVEHSRKMVDELRKAGADVRYTEVPGVGHDVWNPAYENPELWKWLFAQRLAPAEKPATQEKP